MINGAYAIVGMFVALMCGGFAGMWAIWPTAYRHGYAEGESDRHHHRKGDPLPAGLVELPHSGRLAVEPDPALWQTPPGDPSEPPWHFAGESEQGWAAESAEYELLTQTTPDPEPEPELTDTGEMRALSDAWIAKMQGDSNEWIWGHLMRTSE